MTTGLAGDEYTIELRIESGSAGLSFQVLSKLTLALESLDQHLVVSVSPLIDTFLVIEGLELGSVRARLKALLKSIDDDGIKDLDIKKVIGSYLVKAKYSLIKRLERADEIAQLNVMEVQAGLLGAAEASGVHLLQGYTPPSLRQVATDVEAMQEALEPLENGDLVTYISAEGRARFNSQLRVRPGDLECLLTRETLTSTSMMILRVKKIDLLGDSQWEFRHDGKPLMARIADQQWLYRFRTRQEAVLPGDSLRVVVEMATAYSFDNEALSVRHTIIQVLEVLPSEGIQPWLFAEDN